MNEFLEKMEKIINSLEFTKDAKEFFVEIYNEGEYDIEDCERKTIDYLYNKYFLKYEEEYYLLDDVEYDLCDVIVDYYEDIVYKISFDILNVYKLDTFDNKEYKTRCNSCGATLDTMYMDIKFKPNIDSYGLYYSKPEYLNLCRQCAKELRDFINNAVL